MPTDVTSATVPAERRACRLCGRYFYPDSTLRDEDGMPYTLMNEPTFYCRGCATCNNCGRYAAINESVQRCKWCSCAVCFTSATLFYDTRPGSQQTYTGGRVPMLCRVHYREKYVEYVCRYCAPSDSQVAVGSRLVVNYVLYFTGESNTAPTICQSCVNRILDRSSDRASIRCAAAGCRRNGTNFAANAMVCNRHTALMCCLGQNGDGPCTPQVPCLTCVSRGRRQSAEIAEMQREQREAAQLARRHSRSSDGTCRSDCTACSSLYASANRGHGVPVFHPAKKISERKHNRSQRFLSVEIEVAGARHPEEIRRLDRVLEKWGAHRVHDGSLPPTGFEINTAPAAGDHFIEQVNEICGALKKMGAFVDNSCGLHVHADARDFKYADIRKVVLLWERLEPAFMATQSAARTGSHYCRPVGSQYANAMRTLSLPDFVKEAGKPKGVKSKFFEGVYGARMSDFAGMRGGHYEPPRGNHYDDSRYHNVNLHSWIYRGTVENRLHSGTVVARKMIDWATTWAKFMDVAYTTTDKEISLINNPVEFMLSKVAPNKSAADYLKARMRTYATEYERGQ